MVQTGFAIMASRFSAEVKMRRLLLPGSIALAICFLLLSARFGRQVQRQRFSVACAHRFSQRSPSLPRHGWRDIVS